MDELRRWAEEITKYQVYCKEAAQMRFKNDIIIFVGRAQSYDKVYFEAKKRAYSIAAEIMKELKEGSSWEVIKTLFETNVKTILDITLVGDIMLEYSEFGTAFVEKILDINTYQAIADLMKKYDAKKEIEFLKEMGYQ